MKKNYFKKQWTLILVLCAFTLAGYSQPAGWTRYQVFNVTNNTASLVTNYQLLLTVNTQALISSGYMDVTGKDIRFGKDLAGTTLFNYWIESGINTTTTKIWVKIDTLPASGSRFLYWFYSNAAATPVTAIAGTFFGPNSSTDSVVVTSGPGGTPPNQRGFKFQPSEDLLVTDFGKREPIGSVRYVTLFNYTTTLKVAQNQVDAGTAGSYNYTSLSKPIWLSQDSSYILTLHQATGETYYYGTSTAAGQHIIYGDMRYCNSCDQNTFPTTILPNYHYGCPDLWYWTKTIVTPAPTYQNITSINDYAYNTSTSIYPNPTTGIVNFILNQNVKVFLYDQMGKLLLSKEINNNNQNIDISNLKNGIYFAKLVNGNKQDIVKITKIN